MAWSTGILKSIDAQGWYTTGSGMSIVNNRIMHYGNEQGYANTTTANGLNIDTRNIKAVIFYNATSQNPLVAPSVDPTLSEAWGIIRFIPKITADILDPDYNDEPYLQAVTIPFSQSYRKNYRENAAAHVQCVFPIDMRVGIIDRIEMHMWFEVPCEILTLQLYYER